MSVCYENTRVVHPTFEQPVKRAGVLHRMTNWFGRRYRIHRDKKKLHSLPDSMLKDIGIHHSDIDYAVEHGRRQDDITNACIREPGCIVNSW